MVLTAEERLCFQRAVTVLETTAAVLFRDPSAGASGASSCQQLEEIMTLCIDLLLVDGDARRVMLLLEDDRYLAALRRLLTINPNVLAGPPPAMSSPVSSTAASLNLSGSHCDSPHHHTNSTVLLSFTPIAFSLLQLKILIMVRDVFVAVLASPPVSAMLVERLVSDKWVDLLLRHLNALRHNRRAIDVEASILESVFVLTNIIERDAASVLSIRNVGTAVPPTPLVGDPEIQLVADRVRASYYDMSARGFAVAVLRAWLVGTAYGSSGKTSPPMMCAVADGSAVREVVGDAVCMLILSMAESLEQMAAKPASLNALQRITTFSAVDVLVRFVLSPPASDDGSESATALPSCVLRCCDQLLVALFRLHRATLSHSAQSPDGCTVSEGIETLLIRTPMGSRFSSSLILWLRAVVFSAFPLEWTDEQVFDCFKEQSQKAAALPLGSGLTSAMRWLRLSFQALIASRRLGELCDALHDVLDATPQAISLWAVVAFVVCDGYARLVADVQASETSCSSSGHAASRSPSLATATVGNFRSALALSRGAAWEAALAVGLVIVGSCRLPTSTKRALEICHAAGEQILALVHELFLFDGHRGALLVLFYDGSTGGILNSIDVAQSYFERTSYTPPFESIKRNTVQNSPSYAWQDPNRLFDVATFLLQANADAADVERLRQQSERDAAADGVTSSLWVERHHKLSVSLLTARVQQLLYASL